MLESIQTEAPNLCGTPNPNSTSSPSTINQVMGEDRIQSGLRDRQIYLDNELKNMTSRANGIYEVNSTSLNYPDTYIDDIKQSVKTLNDTVKKDLQEYRLNLHLASVQEK